MLVIVANTIVDSVISPHIMGKSVGLSSLMVFISLLVWGWVLGGIGALIAVPMTLMVKLLFFDSFESTRPISEFMEAARSKSTGSASARRRRRLRWVQADPAKATDRPATGREDCS